MVSAIPTIQEDTACHHKETVSLEEGSPGSISDSEAVVSAICSIQKGTASIQMEITSSGGKEEGIFSFH